MPYDPQQVRIALRHLKSADPVLGELIRRVGPFRLRTQSDRFAILVRSIISQQISGKAADSIRRKLEARIAPGKLSAENIHRLTIEELRAVGLSPQKASYLTDLADQIVAGSVQLRTIGRLPDEAVIEQLTQVKGIGRWTAQMFLIFSLGRMDVFPHDDLGIRSAIRRYYKLGELPDKQTSLRIAEPWRPYASIASWYCWRGCEIPPDAP
ncbi:MAG: DNA-3-methyladenine glycosylase [Planctomycetaceae bacterium]